MRGGGGQWRSIDDVIDTPAGRRWLEHEMPAAAQLLAAKAGRRDVLRGIAASLLLAGLPGCDVYPPEDAVPWVEQPEGTVPGTPRFYATVVPFMGYARPVVAECHAGRPTRLDGNARVPGGGTALDPAVQAAVLQLYDPDRSAGALRAGAAVPVASALAALRDAFDRPSGDGVRLLTGQVTSPTTRRQIATLKTRLPGLRWHAHESVGDNRRRAASARAFGTEADVHLHLDRADEVISLDDDLLGPGPMQLRYAADWSERRRRGRDTRDLNRLYVAESTPTTTGAKAARRLRVPNAGIPHLVAAIARAVDLPAPAPTLTADEHTWAETVARRLQAAAPRGLLTVGEYQTAEVQALALTVNHRLGNLGHTVTVSEPVAARPDGDLGDLHDAMRDEAVDLLLVLDADPVFDAPGDLDMAAALHRVAAMFHLGLYQDATAQAAAWHLPLAHPLETWSDARGPDGTVSIGQPTVRPIYGGLHLHAVLDRLSGGSGDSALRVVRDTWRDRLDDTEWRQTLHDGVVPDTAAAAVETRPRRVDVDLPPRNSGAMEVIFRPDPSLWDGRNANVGWLQELPQPITKLTWDNAALLSPALAARLGVDNGRLVELETPTGTLTLPAWIVPGQAETTVTLHVGQGRHEVGQVAADAGTNVNPLRRSADPFHATLTRIAPADGRRALADTQMHGTMDGHDLVRLVSAAEVDAPPTDVAVTRATLYPGDFEHERRDAEVYAWAMAIDLDVCIGCNACVTACVAENNILIVGRDQVRMGREMHWIRVDRYFEGDRDDPAIHFQPVTCMHCEHAPCELGCPVQATVHGPEGLNQMVYNRCIGTRTCSSYCPYKVRRFNWYDYSRPADPSIEALRNPDVTVRSRGVMEKCTYCVQRISGARRDAKKQGRRIHDGEVVTACQAACPTQAITFGDRNDPTSRVAAAKRDARDYTLLDELNVRPRTSYAARVRDEEDES